MKVLPSFISVSEKKIINIFSTRGAKHVWSTLKDRNDPRWKAISETFLSFSRDQVILDIGCGKGRYLRELENIGKKVIGMEPNEEFIAELKEKHVGVGSIISGSITFLPFKKEVFSGVLCSEVLEHVIDVNKAIDEIYRVLKQGGTALILDKSIYGFNHHHFKLYPYSIEKFFKERKDQWMYPKNFFFRERRFDPWRMKGVLANRFSSVNMRFIPYDATPESWICRHFHFLRQMVVWTCQK